MLTTCTGLPHHRGAADAVEESIMLPAQSQPCEAGELPPGGWVCCATVPGVHACGIISLRMPGAQNQDLAWETDPL